MRTTPKVAPRRTTLFIAVALAASIALTCRAVGLSRLIALESAETAASSPSSRFREEGWHPTSIRVTVGDTISHHPGGRSRGSGLARRSVSDSQPRPGARSAPSAAAASTQGLPVNAATTDPPNLSPTERMLVFMTGQFGSGFRNSAMAFTWLVMYARENNYTSIMLESLAWEDLFGSGVHPWAFVPHSMLFDVEHWNEHYPLLPRLVSLNDTSVSIAHREAHGDYWDAYEQYMNYSTLIASDPIKHPKSLVEIAMLRGAFRPCREIRGHMDKLTGGKRYAALHARVEPDMQGHLQCTDLKVLKLSDVVKAVEARFPLPDFDRLFIATNRILLEDEVYLENPDNEIEADNLRELNRIRDEGMWNGSVSVFEAGVSYLRENSKGGVGSYFGISGAVLDYFLALQSTTFVGTEVSSFSTDLIQSRFYRSEFRNYHYRPDGLHIATTPSDILPPRFVC